MEDAADEGRKAEVLSRIDRFRELVEQDAPAMLLEAAHEEVRRSLDGLTRTGRAQGDPATLAAEGESPPGLRS